MQYSDDLRQKLVDAWKAGYGTQAELAEWFGVSLSWAEKVLRRWRTTGQTTARSFRRGPLPVVSPARLERLVQQRPAATLAELGRRLKVSASTVYRALERLNLPRKKDSGRDTPRVERLRARWRQRRRRLDSRQLIFVDESGLNLALTRLYARAPRGMRAVGSVPQNYGQSLTVLGAFPDSAGGDQPRSVSELSATSTRTATPTESRRRDG